jgi:hypothetical protein
LELLKVPDETDGTMLWAWLAFLRATKEEAMKMLGEMDPGIEIARKRLIELSADKNTRRLAEWRAKQLSDWNTNFADDLTKGLINKFRLFIYV